jgi:hypothetical protein
MCCSFGWSSDSSSSIDSLNCMSLGVIILSSWGSHSNKPSIFLKFRVL